MADVCVFKKIIEGIIDLTKRERECVCVRERERERGKTPVICFEFSHSDNFKL